MSGDLGAYAEGLRRWPRLPPKGSKVSVANQRHGQSGGKHGAGHGLDGWAKSPDGTGNARPLYVMWASHIADWWGALPTKVKP
jgi:hypothetical protein